MEIRNGFAVNGQDLEMTDQVTAGQGMVEVDLDLPIGDFEDGPGKKFAAREFELNHLARRESEFGRKSGEGEPMALIRVGPTVHLSGVEQEDILFAQLPSEQDCFQSRIQAAITEHQLQGFLLEAGEDLGAVHQGQGKVETDPATRMDDPWRTTGQGFGAGFCH